MAPKKKNEPGSEITILELSKGRLDVCILGVEPLIYNAMSEKAKRELLYPSAKKNNAERATTLKHDPLAEYRNSVYRSLDPRTKALLSFPSAAFKKSAATAALDIPGAAKTEMMRLMWAVGQRVEIYGVPKLLSAIVRSGDMARTPDVRTRAILPEWACRLTMAFMRPNLTDQAVARLLAAAGDIRGIGDWRQEKGSGNFGQFKMVSEDDPDFVRICATQGRAAQEAALAEPTFYDDETEKLISWFVEEQKRRSDSRGRTNGKQGTVEA